MSDCVFCGIHEGRLPARFVERNEYVNIFHPIGPHAPGHVLVVPVPHFRDAVENEHITSITMREAAKYAATVGPCNIITSVGAEATQSVFHLHVHVVPRGPEDGLPAYWPWFKRDEVERLNGAMDTLIEALKGARFVYVSCTRAVRL